jgi:allantoicase
MASRSPPGRGGARRVHELSALKNGGRIVAYNDAHYGTVWTLLTEGRGLNMGDGWETRRRREPGNDWIIVRLGAAGLVERIVIDTCHYKGNYPDRASLQAAFVEAGTDDAIVTQSMFWPELLPPQKLSADAIHEFDGELPQHPRGGELRQAQHLSRRRGEPPARLRPPRLSEAHPRRSIS